MKFMCLDRQRRFGSVVGLQQIANNSQPRIRRYVAVKLENEFTVQARFDGHVTLVPSDCAAFLEITTPLLGFNVISSNGIWIPIAPAVAHPLESRRHELSRGKAV